MATIYRKTEKGQTEIETRLFRLLPRMRTALILVDGHRTDLELGKLIPGDPVSTLQTLLEGGFIEVTAIVEQRAAPTRPGGLPQAPDTAGRAGAARSPAFDQRRRDAIRALNDQLGPEGELLSIRLEKAADWNALLPILRQGQQVLRNARGAGPAADFAARFIDTPPD